VVLSASTPSAVADPPQFPDLSGYTAVKAADYKTYSAYMTVGLQFVTPGGYRCRMSFTQKANASIMACWGSLPGTPHNHAALTYLAGSDNSAATFDDVDLSKMESYQWMDGPGAWHDGTVDPRDYTPLPPHSKVTFLDGPSQTCAVDDSITACELTDPDRRQQHGFVLASQGSWTF
jgi:hypothetical protein